MSFLRVDVDKDKIRLSKQRDVVSAVFRPVEDFIQIEVNSANFWAGCFELGKSGITCGS